MKVVLGWYFRLAAGMLVFFGILKGIEVAGGKGYLRQADPIIDFASTGQLLVAVATVEVALGLYLLFGRRMGVKALLLTWLGASFLLYRSSLGLMGADDDCGCLGALGDFVGLSAGMIEGLSIGIAVYILVGGLIGLGYMFSQQPVGRRPFDELSEEGKPHALKRGQM